MSGGLPTFSRGENLIQTPAMREEFLPYSDLEKHTLLCYTLEEILVEKLRSVMQRMQARDLYDIRYLPDFEQAGTGSNASVEEF
jgi:predicted nucleotidyltransferase component of viral defense system